MEDAGLRFCVSPRQRGFVVVLGGGNGEGRGEGGCCEQGEG